METLIAPAVNLLALLGILAFYLKKPLSQFVVARHHSVREELDLARRALMDAQNRNNDLSARMKALDSEIELLRVQSREEAEKTGGAILAQASALAGLLLSDCQTAARAAQAEFKLELRQELATRALFRAESRLRDRLTGEDHARIRREFSFLVEQTQ